MSSYINPPVTTDADALAEIFFETIQARFPSFDPAAGGLATVAGEGFSRIAAFCANIFAAQPKAAFRFLGTLFNILPLDAGTASVFSTWTSIDDAGYLIPAGTQVAIQAPDGTQQLFLVATNATIAPGDTTTADGAVTLIAAFPGAAANALGDVGTPAQLVDILAAIDTVTLTGPTSGGIDGEKDDAYLGRLATDLRLQSPSAIRPADAAALALNTSGIGRALAIDLYIPAVNEVQHLAVDATGGTFTLTFGGHTSAAIAYSAAASAVQAALELNVSIGAGGVQCIGGPLPANPVMITFIGPNGGTNEALITTGSGSLTGGTHTATVTGITNGAPADDDAARAIAVAVAATDGNPASSNAKATFLTSMQTGRIINCLLSVIDPTYTEIDVTFEIQVFAGLDADAVTATATSAVTAFLDPANWGLYGTGTGAPGPWVDSPIVRYTDLAAAIKNVPGVFAITNLQLCVHGGSLDDLDVALTGPAPLTTPGTIIGSHT